MGESIWGHIKFKVPKNWCWLEGSEDEGLAVGSDWLDAASNRLRDLIITIDAVGEYASDLETEVEYGSDDEGEFALIQYAGNWNYGVNSEALGFFAEHMIPYEAHDDSKYEFPAQNFWFDPTIDLDEEAIADNESNTVIAGYELLKFLDADDIDGMVAFIRERLKNERFDVAKCSIKHLHDIPYDDPEEESDG